MREDRGERTEDGLLPKGETPRYSVGKEESDEGNPPPPSHLLSVVSDGVVRVDKQDVLRFEVSVGQLVDMENCRGKQINHASIMIIPGQPR